MSNEELAIEIRNGHTELQAQLWDNVKGYITKRASSFFLLGKDFLRCEKDDLIQSGYVAMMDAAMKYDESRGKFLTFLTFFLRRAFIETATGCTEKQKNDPLYHADDLYRELSEEGYTIEEITSGDSPSPEEVAIDKVDCEILRKKLSEIMDKVLTDREREIIHCRYYSGETLQGIARRENVPPLSVASVHASAIKKLRRHEKELSPHYVDERTNFFLSVGIGTFNRTNESTVEMLADRREKLRRKLRVI